MTLLAAHPSVLAAAPPRSVGSGTKYHTKCQCTTALTAAVLSPSQPASAEALPWTASAEQRVSVAGLTLNDHTSGFRVLTKVV